MRARYARRAVHPLHDGAAMKRSLVIVLGLVGCSSTPSSQGPDANPDELFPAACPTTTCTIGATIADAAALAATIDAMAEWTAVGPYTSGCLPASDDRPITGTVTLRAEDVALPSVCANRADCRAEIRFVLRGAPAGVTCLDPETWFEFTLCEGITVTDATIRLRTVMRDIHPSSFGNFAPVVEVLPACEAPCGATELACEAAHTCWDRPRDHCAYCLGGTNEACACWADGEVAADGTACRMFVSGDVEVGGTCVAGACVAP